MEALFGVIQGLPYFDTISTTVVVASGITAVLKDNYAEKIPILGKIWPVLNWLAMNFGHNENNKNGFEKGSKK